MTRQGPRLDLVHCALVGPHGPHDWDDGDTNRKCPGRAAVKSIDRERLQSRVDQEAVGVTCVAPCGEHFEEVCGREAIGTTGIALGQPGQPLCDLHLPIVRLFAHADPEPREPQLKLKPCLRVDDHPAHGWSEFVSGAGTLNRTCPGCSPWKPLLSLRCTQEVGPFEEECGQPAVGEVAGAALCIRHWPAIAVFREDELSDADKLASVLVELAGWREGHRQEPGDEILDELDGPSELGEPRRLRDEVINEICQWWAEVAAKDVLRFAPKAAEYGSADLELMGDGLRLLSGGTKWWGEGNGDAGEQRQAGQEMAILFYLYGKLARALGAYAEGRLPSDDTYEDLRIYAYMLTRVRQFGRLL